MSDSKVVERPSPELELPAATGVCWSLRNSLFHFSPSALYNSFAEPMEKPILKNLNEMVSVQKLDNHCQIVSAGLSYFNNFYHNAY